jgi:hypothetical protein
MHSLRFSLKTFYLLVSIPEIPEILAKEIKHFSDEEIIKVLLKACCISWQEKAHNLKK